MKRITENHDKSSDGNLPLKKVAQASQPVNGRVRVSRLAATITSLMLGIAVSAQAATYYVSTSGNDTASGEDGWENAKQSIQAAINVAPAESEIIVTNGIYAPISTTNQVITIRSVEGAEHTIIDGGGTDRCVTLGLDSSHTNTVLTGFTLQNGNAIHENVKVEVGYGGGSCGGTLNACTLTNNTANYGGGACGGILHKCILMGNMASHGGGGAYDGTLLNCTLTRNSAYDFGGGSYLGTLNNCMLTSNAASSVSHDGTQTNEMAKSIGGGSYGGKLNNCVLMGNTANFGGGSSSSALNNCILRGNTAG